MKKLHYYHYVVYGFKSHVVSSTMQRITNMSQSQVTVGTLDNKVQFT